MKYPSNRFSRRRFIRGSGIALALPNLHSLAGAATTTDKAVKPKRLACFYFPDGVPMPLPEDPAYQDWAWFPHGGGEILYEFIGNLPATVGKP